MFKKSKNLFQLENTILPEITITSTSALELKNVKKVVTK